MRYIVCQQPGQFSMGEKPDCSVGKEELLVGIRSIGICGTDFHAYRGNQAYFTYPRILGHELGGVLLTGNDLFAIGDRVVVLPYIHCGTCHACKQGKSNCCVTLEVLGVHIDGGMQERLAIHPKYLLRANGLDFDALALVEPLSIAAHAVSRTPIQPNSWNLVIGCGPIGLGLIKMIKLNGGNVIALDTNTDRLQFAKDVMQADKILSPNTRTTKKVEDITQGSLAQTVFDATGNKAAIQNGPSLMAHGGTFVIVGLYKDSIVFHHPSLHAKEATIKCSRNATIDDFKKVIGILEKGEFPVDQFITHRATFNELINKFDSWQAPDSSVIKAVVQLSSSDHSL